MTKRRTPKPLLRAASLGATAGLVTACMGSRQPEEQYIPLPGNPKGSMYELTLASGEVVLNGPQPGEGATVTLTATDDHGTLLTSQTLPASFPLAFSLSATVHELDSPPKQVTVQVVLDDDGDPGTPPTLPASTSTAPVGATGLVVELAPPIMPPGNPKGSMYDEQLEKELSEPKQ